MKLLMIYSTGFGYHTSMKTIEEGPDLDENVRIENALVGFIHVEAADADDTNYVETKLVKNMKWAARKNDTQRVILHTFAHLSESKGSPEVTKAILDGAQERLEKAGYEVSQTPFGYFLDLDLQAPGHPLARLFKDIQVG